MSSIQTLSDVPWDTWTPQLVATLLFVVRGDQILLIRKKRGLGEGKINGPGGKVDPGETPFQCALRETQEELLIDATGVRELGELSFQFADGLSIHVHVFRADGYHGEPTETPEAQPLWFDINKIPYDEMWVDDRHWLPHLLAEQRFDGRFIFDGDAMLDYELKSVKS